MSRIVRSLPLLALLCAATSAFAVFPNAGADTEFTSVGQFGGASGVAIDARWVLTAQHVNGSVFSLPGFGDFNVIENYEPEVINGERPDLRLVKVDRDIPFFTKIDTRLPIGGAVDIVGFGVSGIENSIGGYQIPGDAANAPGTRRRATNRIEGLENISFNESGVPFWSTMYYNLSAPGDSTRTANEGGLAGGDSGGGFFYDFGQGRRLIATNSAVGGIEADPNNFLAYGATGYGTYLGNGRAVDFINAHVPQAVVPEPATMAALGLGAVALLRRRKR